MLISQNTCAYTPGKMKCVISRWKCVVKTPVSTFFVFVEGINKFWNSFLVAVYSDFEGIIAFHGVKLNRNAGHLYNTSWKIWDLHIKIFYIGKLKENIDVKAIWLEAGND